MTGTSSQDARALADVHLLSAQLRLVGDPDAAHLVAALNAVRAELQYPPLRLVRGGAPTS